MICRPTYRANGTIEKLRFQLVVTTPDPEQHEYTEADICDWCNRYVKPRGTFEVTMTNGTKFETAFHRFYQHTRKKLSINDAQMIYFDVSDIVNEISVYLHTSIILEKYN